MELFESDYKYDGGIVKEGGLDVPLFSADTVINIWNNVALIEITQYFMNTLDETVEMQYVQPTHIDSVLADIRIKVGDWTLVSRVKTIEKATEIFEDKTAEQKPAAIAKFSSVSWDV